MIHFRVRSVSKLILSLQFLSLCQPVWAEVTFSCKSSLRGKVLVSVTEGNENGVESSNGSVVKFRRPVPSPANSNLRSSSDTAFDIDLVPEVRDLTKDLEAFEKFVSRVVVNGQTNGQIERQFSQAEVWYYFREFERLNLAVAQVFVDHKVSPKDTTLHRAQGQLAKSVERTGFFRRLESQGFNLVPPPGEDVPDPSSDLILIDTTDLLQRLSRVREHVGELLLANERYPDRIRQRMLNIAPRRKLIEHMKDYFLALNTFLDGVNGDVVMFPQLMTPVLQVTEMTNELLSLPTVVQARLWSLQSHKAADREDASMLSFLTWNYKKRVQRILFPNKIFPGPEVVSSEVALSETDVRVLWMKLIDFYGPEETGIDLPPTQSYFDLYQAVAFISEKVESRSDLTISDESQLRLKFMLKWVLDVVNVIPEKSSWFGDYIRDEVEMAAEVRKNAKRLLILLPAE